MKRPTRKEERNIMHINFDRFDALVAETGITKSHLCRIADKSRYYLRDAKKYNIDIPESVVETFASALGTTPEYLIGNSDEKKKPTTETGDGLDEKRRRALNLIEAMNDEQLDALLKLFER